MSKLHELLAIEQSLRGQAETTRKDLMNTFEKKRHHFSEALVTFKSNKEGVEDKIESQLGLQTTVAAELKWIAQKIAAAMDTSYQIDLANQEAKSDVVLDNGDAILRDIPATTLLQIEKKLKEIQELAQQIPTLDPSKGFELDKSKGDGIYRARDVIKPRTEKCFQFVVMTQATKEHPAQIKELMADVTIGSILCQEWSSLITTGQKAMILDRIEEMTRAVKKARSRANEQEINVKENKIAETILSYILGI